MHSVLTRAIEARDPYTRGHSARVTALAEAVALQARLERGAAALLRSAARSTTSASSRFRRGAPQAGPLDDEELAQIREHPQLGARILLRLAALRERSRTCSATTSAGTAAAIRPAGGEEIPLEARISPSPTPSTR